MITFTETARQKVREYMDMSETPSLGVRVVAHRFGRHQFRYELALVTEGENSEKDVVVDQEAFEVFVDPKSGGVYGGDAGMDLTDPEMAKLFLTAAMDVFAEYPL